MRCAIAFATLIAASTLAQAQTPAGPSSLQETYGDWIVACVSREGSRRCVMAQRLQQQDGRQVAAMELAPAGDGLSGMLVMPFGLAFDEGVTLAVDGGALAERRFSTCLPGGCLVPLSAEAGDVSRLAAGERLEIAAVANETGEPVELAMSLSGFAAAHERLAELAR